MLCAELCPDQIHTEVLTSRTLECDHDYLEIESLEVKLRTLDTLYSDWCPWKRNMDIQKYTRGTHTKERKQKDIARRQPSTSQRGLRSHTIRHFDLGLSTSRTIRKQISVVTGIQSVFCCDSTSELTTTTPSDLEPKINKSRSIVTSLC